MSFRIFGKIKLNSGLFFLIHILKVHFPKIVYLSDINNKYFKLISFVKKEQQITSTVMAMKLELSAALICVKGCLHNRANIEQTSSRHRANIELAQAGLLEPRPIAQM